MKYNAFDEQEYSAFIFNESKLSTDDRELDEFECESIFGDDEVQIFDTEEL